MRTFAPQTPPKSTKTSAAVSNDPPVGATEQKKPEWMVRLQQKQKEELKSPLPTKDYNRNEILFPKFDDSKTEILYLDDEDDVAQAYFPGAGKNGESISTMDTDCTDNTGVSGYNFDDLVEE